MRKIEGFCEIPFFRGEGPDFRPKFQKVFFFAVEVIFLDQIKKFSAYDLLLGE